MDKLNSHLELWKCNCSTIWSAVIFYDDYMKKQYYIFTTTVNHHDAFRAQLCCERQMAILELEDQLPGCHGWWPGKVLFILPFTYFEVNAYRCFGLALSFSKLAGILIEPYDILIVSYAILISSAAMQSEGRGVTIPRPMQNSLYLLCYFKGKEEKCHYHNNAEFMCHNHNRTLLTCWLLSLGNLNVATQFCCKCLVTEAIP